MATNVSFAGPAAGSIISPSAQKQTLASNYLNFHGSGGDCPPLCLRAV